jgi:DNA-binding transcriptional LysR family regulator
MYVESLKIFCDVVRHHSFSRGANANGVSQSAASQAILQIEKNLGLDLLDRSQRPWVLTSEGEVFFDGAQELVNRYLELLENVRRHKASSGYNVRVAAIYSVGMQDMGHYVEQLKARMPGSDAEMEYMHPDRVYESVLRGEADLGLIAFARSRQDLESLPWREEPMVFTCLPDHRLAGHRSIRPADLRDEKFVRFQRGLAIRREVDRFLRQHAVEVDVVAELDNIATIKQAVEDGAGVSILPEPTLKREIERGSLVAIPFTGIRFIRPLSIIHRRKRKLNSAMTGFIELLRATNGSTGSREHPSREATVFKFQEHSPSRPRERSSRSRGVSKARSTRKAEGARK